MKITDYIIKNTTTPQFLYFQYQAHNQERFCAIDIILNNDGANVLVTSPACANSYAPNDAKEILSDVSILLRVNNIVQDVHNIHPYFLALRASAFGRNTVELWKSMILFDKLTIASVEDFKKITTKDSPFDLSLLTIDEKSTDVYKSLDQLVPNGSFS